jgi:hypothetical protein
MKIGLSYSRCVRDIIDEKVNIADVLVIVARTDFDPSNDKQWAGIWQGYGGGTDNTYTQGFFSHSNPEWAGYSVEDEAKFREVTIQLYENGQLFQPRQHGAYPRRLPYYWLETFLPDSELDKNPAAKKAFEKFKMIAGLVSPQPATLNDNF